MTSHDETGITAVPQAAQAPSQRPTPRLGGPLASRSDIEDRLAALEETYSRPTIAGCAVVDGFGVRIRVEGGALEISDGVGQKRRVRRFDRATHGLRRIVVMNATGNISLDAVRWCQSVGVGLVVLGSDDLPQLVSMPRRTDDARLRRVQALAPDRPVGLDIARTLLGDKLIGQARVLTAHFGADDVASTVLDLADALGSSTTTEECRSIEATAAAIYWQTWAGRPETVPTFVGRDRARVPAHWNRFETRRSVLGSARGNRRAERPTNSMLNFVYRLVEIEATFACLAVLPTDIVDTRTIHQREDLRM